MSDNIEPGPRGEDAGYDWHICRTWDPPDPFAPECGCPLLPCGHVSSDASGDCEQHGIEAAKSMRSGHRQKFCKGGQFGRHSV